MGCRMLHDRTRNTACLYCSTTDWAFGPVFTDSDDHDADERLEAFLRWLATTETWWSYEREPLIGERRRDPRQLTEAGLGRAYSAWLMQEPAQWAREEREERTVWAEE